MKRKNVQRPLGIQIKTAMIQQNITGRELASRINRSEATVCEVISGKNRNEATRRRILEELKLTEEAQ